MIYLDWAAASPPLPEVFTTSQNLAKDYFYNPSTVYEGGRQTKMMIDEARSQLAGLLNVNSQCLFFTAGATEANNFIIQGFSSANNCRTAGLIIDHPSLLKNVDILLKVDTKTGFIKLDEIANLADDIGLLSLAGINSQTGVIQPFSKIKRVVNRLNEKRLKKKIQPLIIHIDASQMGFIHPINPQSIKADLVTYNSGKIGGPKQAGFFYCQRDINLKPVFKGGRQENKLRPGTESIQQIYGTLTAFKMAIEGQKQLASKLLELRTYFEGQLKNVGAKIVLESSRRSPHIVGCLLPDNDAEKVVLHLSRFGIYVGLGSACQSLAKSEMSNESVLDHLSFSEQEIKSYCRFSFGPPTTIDQLQQTIDKLKLILNT